MTLNPEYTFENLVVGSSNQFAYVSAKAVADNPGKVYNPLIIYGDVGLGKTHLLHAIGNEAYLRGKSVTYDTFEQFFNEMRRCINAKTMHLFRDRYRNTDLLLLDDIQFIANKDVLQEEFFNTFNDLKRMNKQIIVTSDRHPKDMFIEERIKNRLEGGLITEVTVPDLQTKKAIIRKKCERNRIVLDESMVSYIVTHVLDNVRVIEGILLSIHAYAVLMDEKVTLELVRHVVEETRAETLKSIELERIVDEVARYCNVKPSEMKSKKRNKEVVKARRIALFLARELTTMNMTILAKEFGLKDHASVSHAVAEVKKLLDEDKDFYEYIDTLRSRIKVKR